jgi:hypothetical protein
MSGWGTFLQPFGPFALPVAGGRTAQLPWHQCSYRREALPLGRELETLLENEGLLHARLHEAGHTLVLELGCVAAHLNPSRLRSLVAFAWHGGRLWGAGRAAYERWTRARRAAHAALVLHTVARELRLRMADVQRVIPERRRRVAPVLSLAIAIHAAGEVAGVLLGPGTAAVPIAHIELNRRAHLRRGEAQTRS